MPGQLNKYGLFTEISIFEINMVCSIAKTLESHGFIVPMLLNNSLHFHCAFFNQATHLVHGEPKQPAQGLQVFIPLNHQIDSGLNNNPGPSWCGTVTRP